MTHDFQQRVIQEKAELDARLTKLAAFTSSNPVFKTLDDVEQVLLCRQTFAMQELSDILADRIARFPTLPPVHYPTPAELAAYMPPDFSESTTEVGWDSVEEVEIDARG